MREYLAAVMRKLSFGDIDSKHIKLFFKQIKALLSGTFTMSDRNVIARADNISVSHFRAGRRIAQGCLVTIRGEPVSHLPELLWRFTFVPEGPHRERWYA